MSRRGDQLRKADKRGSRRAAAQRHERARPKKGKRGGTRGPSAIGHWLRRIALWGGLAALLGVVALAIAVGVSLRSLPSFHQLQSPPNAKTIELTPRRRTQHRQNGPS